MAQAFVHVSQALRAWLKRSSMCLKPYAHIARVRSRAEGFRSKPYSFVLRA
jgi:hypothetical protein